MKHIVDECAGMWRAMHDLRTRVLPLYIDRERPTRIDPQPPTTRDHFLSESQPSSFTIMLDFPSQN